MDLSAVYFCPLPLLDKSGPCEFTYNLPANADVTHHGDSTEPSSLITSSGGDASRESHHCSL